MNACRLNMQKHSRRIKTQFLSFPLFFLTNIHNLTHFIEIKMEKNIKQQHANGTKNTQ